MFAALLTGLYADNWESAFAISVFFRFLGLSIAFAFHGVLCNYYKLYTLGICLLLAVVPFSWLEVRLENMRKVKNIIRLWPRLNIWWFFTSFHISINLLNDTAPLKKKNSFTTMLLEIVEKTKRLVVFKRKKTLWCIL